MTPTDENDPFLVRPDQRVRSNKPISAPPPSGPRIEGLAPPSVLRAGQPPPDANAYLGQAPTGYGVPAFARSWRVTFRRWGRAWLAFLGVSLLFGSILGPLYPSPDPRIGDQAFSYYWGSFLGLGAVFLILFLWWLDHVLARAGWVVSLTVQGIICGGIGLALGIGPEGNNDPTIGFPPGFYALVGILGVALAHLLGQKVQGSFEPSPG